MKRGPLIIVSIIKVDSLVVESNDAFHITNSGSLGGSYCLLDFGLVRFLQYVKFTLVFVEKVEVTVNLI